MAIPNIPSIPGLGSYQDVLNLLQNPGLGNNTPAQPGANLTNMINKAKTFLGNEKGRDKISKVRDWLNDGGRERIKTWYDGGGKDMITKGKEWLDDGGREKIIDWYGDGGKEKLQRAGQWYKGPGQSRIAQGLNSVRKLKELGIGQRLRDRVSGNIEQPLITPETIGMTDTQPTGDSPNPVIPPGPAAPGSVPATPAVPAAPQYNIVNTPFGPAVHVPGRGFVRVDQLTDADKSLLTPQNPPLTQPLGDSPNPVIPPGPAAPGPKIHPPRIGVDGPPPPPRTGVDGSPAPRTYSDGSIIPTPMPTFPRPTLREIMERNMKAGQTGGGIPRGLRNDAKRTTLNNIMSTLKGLF